MFNKYNRCFCTVCMLAQIQALFNVLHTGRIGLKAKTFQNPFKEQEKDFKPV